MNLDIIIVIMQVLLTVGTSLWVVNLFMKKPQKSSKDFSYDALEKTLARAHSLKVAQEQRLKNLKNISEIP